MGKNLDADGHISRMALGRGPKSILQTKENQILGAIKNRQAVS
jgi:hypothetical protein